MAQIKYTFVHSTKCGGTACEQFFQEHYSDYIIGQSHALLCKNDNNPIFIVRDPIDRFISMYKYWKNGTEDTNFKRKPEFIEKYNKFTIKDYIHLMKHSIRELTCDFTWYQHYKPQTSWISQYANYKNIIIIKYEPNLNNKIQKLLELLQIPSKNINLPIIHVSSLENCNCELDDEDIAFIKQNYKTDYELLDKINNNPQLFKLVI